LAERVRQTRGNGAERVQKPPSSRSPGHVNRESPRPVFYDFDDDDDHHHQSPDRRPIGVNLEHPTENVFLDPIALQYV